MHFFPTKPAPAFAHGKEVVVGFEGVVSDGMDAVEVFAEEFEVAEIVADMLPTFAQGFVPRVLAGCAACERAKTP